MRKEHAKTYFERNEFIRVAALTHFHEIINLHQNIQMVDNTNMQS